MTKSKTRRVVFQPATYQGIQEGVNQIVNAIRPTLGPQPRTVAIERISNREKMPEMLDNGGLIARRIIQIAGRDADVGAMFIRQMLWRLHEKVGDGTATAAVIFQTIFDEGLRYIAAGGNAQRLRYYLEEGLRVIDEQLAGMTMPVEGRQKLAQIAQSVCYDPEMSRLVGEIFDIIGEYGRLEIRGARGRELDREYVEGIYFEHGVMSREMILDQTRQRTDFENAAILISDLDIDDPYHLMPVMLVAVKAGFKSMVIVANKLADSVLGFLLANNKKQAEKFQIIAVSAPGFGVDRMGELEDIAVLTGGRAFLSVTREGLQQAQAEDLGQARRVWADRKNFGIIGGKGNARQLRQHISKLRAAFDKSDDPAGRQKLQQRIGRLMGGSATLWVGGTTENDIDLRKELAKRTASAMRGAVREGVLPGGGVALLNCRPTIRQHLEQSANADERAAYGILLKALEAPFRTVVSNAGYDDRDLLAELRLVGPGYGFDVNAKKIVDVVEAGILDVATVQRAAVHSAISSAALALTVDVMVHHKRPQQAAEP
ncbi:MAG: chaperonin GroEL [Anaerolineae bacterium]|nr:chaperonin GroEL [Anaerolineae bacterium]